MLVDLIRTSRTYATRENALKALRKKLGGTPEAEVPYLIAVNAEGRFAPVLIGVKFLPFIHHGITVVG